MRTFLTFFILQVINFILLVTNIRALAHLQYTMAVLTDGLICFMSWTVFKAMQRDVNSWAAKVGFISGGMVGSLLGMYITRRWG